MTAGRTLGPHAQLALILIMLIWGFQQVAIKMGNAELAPIWQAALRSIGATVLLGAWWIFRRSPVPRVAIPALPAALLVLLFTLDFGCLYVGLSLTSVSRGILLYYLSPVMVVFITLVFRLEARGTSASWAVSLLAFAGMVLVVWPGDTQATNTSIPGDLLCIAAAAGWAGGTLLIKHTGLQGIDTLELLLIQIGGSALAFPLLSLWFGEPWQLPQYTQTIVVLAFQILIGAVLSYMMFFYLLQRYSASHIAVYSFLAPCFGVLLSWLVLGEPMTPTYLLGAFMIVLSLAWTGGSAAR